MRSNFEATRRSSFKRSSGQGLSLNFTVFTRASANSLPMTCTASISKSESPTERRLVTTCESSCLRTSKKAWIFHW